MAQLSSTPAQASMVTATLAGKAEDEAPRSTRWTMSSTIRNCAYAVFIALIVAALVLPIWTVRFVPLFDYPIHLATSFVLAHVDDSAFSYSEYYSSDWNTYPYLATHLVLVGLQRFIPIDLAGRLLLTLCVLAVPAATWFFLRRANPGQETLAIWSSLVTHNLNFFQFGMLNQQLGLAFCFTVLGVWVGYLKRPRISNWCLLLGLTTALYFTHLMAFAMTGFIMTVYLIAATRRIRAFLQTWALFLPGVLLFFCVTASHVRGNWTIAYSLFTKFEGMLTVMSTAFSPTLDLLTFIAVIVVFIVAIYDNNHVQINGPWALASGCVLLLFLALPSNLGPKGMLADRRALVFFVLVVLASVKFGNRSKLVAALVLVIFSVRLGFIERYFVSVQNDASAIAESFSAIPKGARVVAIALRNERFQHFWAYGVIQRGWRSPCLYFGPGVLPLRTKYQSDQDCGYMYTQQTDIAWQRIRRDFDYIWLYKEPTLAPPGEVVYSDGNVRVLRLSKPPSGI